MPLLAGDQRLDVSLSAARIVQLHSHLQDRAKSLTNQPTQTFGPKGFLYVQQREFAVTTPSDRSGATCLAHCDGSDTEREVRDILCAVKSLSQDSKEGRLELHIVGGFLDKKRLSQRLCNEILRAFDKQKDEVHLATYCVSDLNNKEENGIHFPIIYGIAVNVKTGEIFKATFQDRGPDEDLRSTYILTGGSMTNIYDAKTEQLRFGPYYWTPLPNIDFWLEQDDEQILQYFSTSPEAEPSHFVAHVKSTFKFVKDNPYPADSVFPDDRPRVYRKNADGLWERILHDSI
ncbi:protein N-terminal asparagine amidohydrolase isoform X2 [Bombina bombina]|uniref:protein N-terminal asparagine amidohydrolase isoform X2 n=1 Tax=Bombina bombina TaxID=8345 RepID=UPI00235B2F31|nr:protein N-terminal asparagine amidohydrolase isoform X2 [Bombina bombina]